MIKVNKIVISHECTDSGYGSDVSLGFDFSVDFNIDNPVPDEDGSLVESLEAFAVENYILSDKFKGQVKDLITDYFLNTV